MSILFEADDIKKLVESILQSSNVDADEIERIAADILKSLSYDGEHIHILSDPESIARDIVHLLNNFYS
jgi:hypothetical protein